MYVRYHAEYFSYTIQFNIVIISFYRLEKLKLRRVILLCWYTFKK